MRNDFMESRPTRAVNCTLCLHTYSAHAKDENSGSLMKLGECRIPGCACTKFRESIHSIDEELA